MKSVSDLVDFIYELSDLEEKKNEITKKIRSKKKKFKIYNNTSVLSYRGIYDTLKMISPRNADEAFEYILSKDIDLSFSYITDYGFLGDKSKQRIEDAAINCLMEHPEKIIDMLRNKNSSLFFSLRDTKHRKKVFDAFHHKMFLSVKSTLNPFYNYVKSFCEFIDDEELGLFVSRVIGHKKVEYARFLLDDEYISERLNDSMNERLNSLLVLSRFSRRL